MASNIIRRVWYSWPAGPALRSEPKPKATSKSNKSK